MASLQCSSSVALALVLLASPAGAEPTEAERTLAESLFQDAKSLMKAGDYARACPKLQESFKLDPVGGTSINLADCTEHLGKWATAITQFQRARTMALQAGRADRVQVADEHLASLERRVTRLVVHVSSPLPGTTITLDGLELGAPSWGSAMMIDPGKHGLDAQAPGKQPFHADVVVAAEPETKTVEVPQLASASVLPVAAQAPARGSPDAAPSPASSSRRTAGLVVGGLGVVSVGVGAYFIARGNSLKTQVNDDPHATDVHDTVASQHAAITFGEIGLGVGVAAIGVGAWLIATSSTGEAPKSAVRLTPMIAANGAGISLGGAW